MSSAPVSAPRGVTLLTAVHDLDAVVTASSARPVLILKHSLTCGASAYAHRELDALVDAQTVAADVFVVPVQTARALSDAIAARFAVRHESPQVLLLKDGQVVWHASHYRITRAAMAVAIAAVGQGEAPRATRGRAGAIEP